MRYWLIAMLAACGNKATPRDEPGGSPVPSAIPSTPPARSPDAATPAPVAPAAAELPAIATEVPTKPAALQAWLGAAHYQTWAKESKPHASDGPHGEAVKTFVSPSLLASLKAGAAAHPVGAAAVKELYKAGKHSGWAVSVKVAADSAQGKGWYWYEVFSTAPAAKPDYEGLGKMLCRDCHTEGGVDQVLAPFPLQ